MSNSGFLCPECRKDLGSLDGLQEHFAVAHGVESKTERIKNVFKGGFKSHPSQQGKNFTNNLNHFF